MSFNGGFFMKYLFRIGFILCFLVIVFYLVNLFFSEIFTSKTIIIPYGLKDFDICKTYPHAWKYIKIMYIILLFTSTSIISNSLFSRFFSKI